MRSSLVPRRSYESCLRFGGDQGDVTLGIDGTKRETGIG